MCLKVSTYLYPGSDSVLNLFSFRNPVGAMQAFYSRQCQEKNGHSLSSPLLYIYPTSHHLAVAFLLPSHFQPRSVCALSLLVLLTEKWRAAWDRFRRTDSTDLMRISADIPNISTAFKNCVEARIEDKAADMGYFDEFKDSAGSCFSSNMYRDIYDNDRRRGCEGRFSLLKHWIILLGIMTKNLICYLVICLPM